MLVQPAIPGTHRRELDAGHSHLPEGRNAPLPFLWTAASCPDPAFDGHSRGVTSGFPDEAAEGLHPRAAVFVRGEMREPTVGELRDTS